MKCLQSSIKTPVHIHLGNRENLEITSGRLKFTPLRKNEADLSFYTSLFCDKVNMRRFKGGARNELQVQNHCNAWHDKWDN